ncbi:MAG TPA: ABC transporter ATP-binding protein [Ruminococcaceae bacterium]|nr:ABC transporter ATP-binding protein [Oscillospiraceae bacterium]
MSDNGKREKKKESGFSVVRKTYKYFFPIAWRIHKGFFFASAIRTVVGAIQPFVAIIVSPLIISELLGERNIARLIVYAAILAVAGPLLSFISSWLSVVNEKYGEKFDNYFEEKMSRMVTELDFQVTEDKNALDQVEKAKTGMDWYSGGVAGVFSPMFEIIGEIFTICGTVALIAVYAPWLFLVTLIVAAVNAIIQNKQNKIEIERFGQLSKINRAFGYYGWQTSDFRYGKDIRLYGAKDLMVERWNKYTDDSIAIWKESGDINHPLDHLKNVFNVSRDIASYLYLGVLVLSGGISIAVFTQMIAASSAFNSSLGSLLYQLQDIVKRCNYAYEFVKFAQFPAAIQKGNRHIVDKPHIIEFKNVSFSYPNTDVKVLDGVSVTLRQGEHLSVVGLNGAGKTTFVKLLCRLYDVSEGEILLDGVNIKEYDYNEYMNLFAPVFQDFKLFAFSVKENIVLDGVCADKELKELIEKVGLADKTASLEKGADTVLFKSFDENGIEPSGGEQQKMAIARALYKKSPVVILDEPTAALDPVAEYDIYRQFSTLVGGKTAIYISHRLSSCKFCDRIAVFSEGRIKEYGTHDELICIDNGIYAEMFKAQAKYYN